ncbi:protein of unknown function (plasmid) [Thermococcus nautili]|nr:protein of unknown function [Thermococcus nautili]
MAYIVSITLVLAFNVVTSLIDVTHMGVYSSCRFFDSHK